MTTDTANNPPAGLGGWLWPVTWASAVLPVFLTASVAASVPSFIGYLEQAQAGPYLEETAWAYRAMGLNVLLTLGAWWWALRWFARDPRLPRQGPIVLIMLGLLCAARAVIDRDPYGDPTLAASLLAFAIAALLCARWSNRIRNTFVESTIPSQADEFDTAVFNGPIDWSRGRWLLPGALLYTIVSLPSEWMVFSQIASETMPAPYPVGPPHDGCLPDLGFGLKTMGHTYSAGQIEAHREALRISHAAVLLIFASLVGLARGARWTPWLAIVALAFAMAAPLRIDLGKWCIYYLDHTDFRGMWHERGIVLILVIVTTAYWRWSIWKTRT